jgi:alginate O-acetyltransferase complex protein AlgI
MLFSSIPFLYYFLPAVLILYFAAPCFLRNVVLLATSLLFYAWGEPRYVILMLIEIVVGYLSGLFLVSAFGKRCAKFALAVAVSVPLLLLGFFKYADFFLENINAVTGAELPLPGLALPIGISFYTFQIISYQIDVYRGNVSPQRNLLALGTYVAMFPQLIAGPIVRYADIAEQLTNRGYSWENAAIGARCFVLGLAKKVLLANRLGELAALYHASDEQSVLFAWLYALAFSLQIYFDFSGYSDMAIGLGRIFGFRFPENFRYPFAADSITDFWRRWHISLGSWFRDYVYIPLGGSRVSRLKFLRNIVIVWLLTGIWHGAAWNFVVWGLLFAVLLLLEKFFLLPLLDKIGIIRHVYVLLCLLPTFVVFNAADMGEAFEDIGSLVGLGGLPLVSAEAIYYLRSYALTVLVAMIGATPLPAWFVAQLGARKIGERVLNLLEPLVLVALLLVVTAFLVDGSFNPFLYFRF